MRRRAHREGGLLPDVAALEGSLREALALFDDGVRAGQPLYDRATTSMLARACCVPHAPWERQEHQRALRLWQRAAASPPSQRVANAQGDVLRQASQWWQCEAEGCSRVARWGSATSGVARACAAHRLADEVRVDLNWEALQAIADSVVEVGSRSGGGPHLAAGAQLYLYLTYAATSSGSGDGFESRRAADAEDEGAPLAPLASLNRYFGACASAGSLPTDARALLPAILGGHRGGRQNTLHAYLRACGRAAAADEAFRAHAAGIEAGIAPTLASVTALVVASGRVRSVERAAEAMRLGRRAGLNVEADPSAVSAYLKASALARDVDGAESAYERALEAGLMPTRAVLNALALAYATAGRVDDALDALDRVSRR